MFRTRTLSIVTQVRRSCGRAARNLNTQSGPGGPSSSNRKRALVYSLAIGATAFGLTAGATIGFPPEVRAEKSSKSDRSRHPVAEDPAKHGTPASKPVETPQVDAEESPVALLEETDKSDIVSPAASNLSTTYQYVIIGSGTAAYGAIKGIRERDPTSPILVVGEEDFPPYQRPPLSKELWFSDDPEVSQTLTFVNWLGQKGSIIYENADVISSQGVELILGKRVVSLDPEEKLLKLSDGTEVRFETALIATGGTPRRPQNLIDSSADTDVSTYRTARDFQKLLAKVETTKHFVVIGGGFLGTELAVALANRGKPYGVKVTQFFPEPGVLYRVLPKYLSDYVTRRLLTEGIDARPNTVVSGIKRSTDGALSLACNSWSDYSDYADHAVLCVGISPNVQLAEEAGLEVDAGNGGILVNADLEARHGIFAAGDACSYHDIALGRRRVEHYDHAYASGKQAGENMAGAKKPYRYQSMFWSSLEGLNLSFEALGIVDSTLQTVAFWVTDSKETKPRDPSIPAFTTQDYRKGVVYYLNKKKHVVGVLLWNMHGKGVEAARNLLLEKKKYSDLSELKSKIVIGPSSSSHIEN